MTENDGGNSWQRLCSRNDDDDDDDDDQPVEMVHLTYVIDNAQKEGTSKTSIRSVFAVRTLRDYDEELVSYVRTSELSPSKSVCCPVESSQLSSDMGNTCTV